MFNNGAKRVFRFAGEIVRDEFTISDFDGSRKYVLGVRPLHFAVRNSEVDHYWKAATVKPEVEDGTEEPAPNSVLGLMINGLYQTFGKHPDGRPYEIGAGEYLGLEGVFELRDVDFGTNKETGEPIKARSVVVAISPLDADDDEVATPDDE